MSRPRKRIPSYVEHRQSGRGRLVWTDAAGIRQEKLLPGPFGSPESLAAKARIELELASSPARTLTIDDELTMNELCSAHLTYAEKHYRRADGTATHEVSEYKTVHRLMRETYGDDLAAEFGPLKLKSLRIVMLQRDWCRSLVNQRIGRVKRMFKWAASEEMILAATYHALATVTGLQRGRTEARESAPVGPVEDQVVNATLPYLGRTIAGMVELQRLTGMRPGEVCIVRRSDIDTGGAVWVYKPAHHKLAYSNKPRIIAIGPRAQGLLREFFTPNLSDYLFSPRRAAVAPDSHGSGSSAVATT